MLSVSHLCRCTQSLRTAQSKLLVSSTRTGFNTTSIISRQLLTQNNKASKFKGLRLTQLLKPQSIAVRLCQTAPKPKAPSKIVGYWLLGCSGMVFTAVVLGMVAGYLVLLYSVYCVVEVALRTTNGKK